MINNKWEGGIEKGCLSFNTTSKKLPELLSFSSVVSAAGSFQH